MKKATLSEIRKDFEDIEKILNGESLPKKKMTSKKIRKIAISIKDYSLRYFEDASIRLYNMYNINPQKFSDFNSIQETKILLRKYSNFYKELLEKRSIFLQNFHKIITSKP